MKAFGRKYPFSGYKAWWLSYQILPLYALIEFIIYFFYLGQPNYWIDTYTYLDAVPYVMQGEPDIWRTPVYPLIIGVLKAIFGSNWDVAMIISQFLIFLVSGIWFYKIARRLVRKPRYVFWSTAFYLLYPGWFVYNFYLLTETLSICGVVFFAYSLLKVLPRPKATWDVIWPVLWLAYLIYLRPVFIYAIPIIALVFIVQIIKYKRLPSDYWGIFGLMILGASLFLYQKEVTKKYNIHSVSCVTIINNYATLRYDGIIDPSCAEDSTLRALLVETLPDKYNKDDELLWKEFMRIVDQVGYPALEQYEKALAKKYPKDLIKSITMRWERDVSSNKLLPHIRGSWKLNFVDWFVPSIGTFALCMLLYSVLLLVQWRRTKKIPYVQVVYLLICIGMYLAIAVGAQSDYTRLILPVVPLIILLFANFCTSVRISPIK